MAPVGAHAEMVEAARYMLCCVRLVTGVMTLVNGVIARAGAGTVTRPRHHDVTQLYITRARVFATHLLVYVYSVMP